MRLISGLTTIMYTVLMTSVRLQQAYLCALPSQQYTERKSDKLVSRANVEREQYEQGASGADNLFVRRHKEAANAYGVCLLYISYSTPQIHSIAICSADKSPSH